MALIHVQFVNNRREPWVNAAFNSRLIYSFLRDVCHQSTE
jgi:hypothetical protein